MLRLKDGRLTDYPLPGAVRGGVMYGRIQERRDGSIWVATSFGLFQFAQGRWEKVELPAGLRDPIVSALLIDSGDTVWAGITTWPDQAGEGRLLFLRPGESHFRTVFESIGPLIDLAESMEGRIWLSRSFKLPRVLQADAQSPYLIGGELRLSTYNLLFDHDKNLWTTEHGAGLTKLARTNVESIGKLFSNEPSHTPPDRFTHEDGLSSDYVNPLFEDREGNIWVGTSGGLDCFGESKIAALSHREGLPYDNYLSIQATTDGAIWAWAAPGGLEKIDPQHLRFTAAGWGNWLMEGRRVGYCLFADQGTNLIAGTGRGLGVIREGKLSSLGLPEGEELKTVIAITRDADGGLWLCDHEKGVLRLVENKFERFPELKRAPTEYVITAHTDSSGRVWLGYAYGGIACYDKGQILRFTSKDGLFSGQVRTVFSDDRGRVWAAGDGGLSRFENRQFRTLNRENGLRDDDIYAVLEDDDQCFWIAGVHGLFRVAKSKLEMAFSGAIQTVDGAHFEVIDGIRGIVCHAPTGTAGSCYTVATKSSDGKLWFSTSAGLAVVDPKAIPKNRVPPVVHIEKIIAAGKTNRVFEHLRFPRGTKDCQLDYVGLSFADPSRVQYEYKLEGYDQDWVNAGTRRQAFYSNLQPKAYRFRARACNNDGVWSENDGHVGFSIAPAFYETASFLALCLAAIALGVFGVYRMRLRRLAERMDLQLAAEQNERRRIAQELHDTLLQGFTGVGLKLDALTTSLPASLNGTKEQFQKTLQQIDQYLTEGRRSIWKLRSPALESVGDFSGALKKASQRALDGTAIALSFSVQGQVRKLKDFFEDHLLRICEEAVANSAKHARAIRIEVTLAFNCKDVQLRIRDDGCGFDTKQFEVSNQGHFGLMGIQERVQSMAGSFLLSSQPGTGTEMTITIRTK
jgi:signal transduction histidine kinase/ligand-binding sensor domain-containing protein